MKKKIISVLLIATMMFSLVGCTPNMASYNKEAQRVAQWEGQSMKATANVAMEVLDAGETVKFSIPMELSGKVKGQDLVEMDMKMSLVSMKEMAKTTGEEIPVSMPDSVDMKIFATQEKAYIEKKFFMDMMGEDAPENLKNIKEDYISIPAGMASLNGVEIPAEDKAQIEAMTNYIKSKEFESSVLSLLDATLKGFKPSVDMKVSGNTFTYEAGIDDLVKDLNLAAETVVKNYSNVETPLVELLNKLGAPIEKEMLQEAVKSYNKGSFEETTKEMKEFLKGSNIKMVSTFEKDSYKQDMELNLNISSMMKMNMVVKSESKKENNVNIVLPKSVKDLTMQEYIELFMDASMVNKFNEPMIFVNVNGEEVEFTDQEPIIKEDRTLVPFRDLFEKMGTKVEWDEKTKTVTADNGINVQLTIGSDIAKVDGKEVKMDVPAEIVNGRTMIPLRFVSENLGYTIDFNNENYPIYEIEVYNISKEELDKKRDEELKAFEELFKGEAEEKVEEAA